MYAEPTTLPGAKYTTVKWTDLVPLLKKLQYSQDTDTQECRVPVREVQGALRAQERHAIDRNTRVLGIVGTFPER